MNSNKTFIIILVIILVAAIWYVFGMQGTSQQVVVTDGDAMEAMESNDAMMVEDAMMADGDAMEAEDSMVADDAMVADTDAMMSATGSYGPYSADKVAMATDGDVVLFFKAVWCPTCRALEADIKANIENLPANVTILEVNYDTATELRQKYGVTTQHTLVQVDANGNLITKWSGGNTLDSVLARIQ